MDEPWRQVNKIFFRAATANVYSSPPFVMETILTFVICSIYVFLHAELFGLANRTVRLKPNVVCMSAKIKHFASDSNTTSITCTRDRLFNASNCRVARSKNSMTMEALKKAARNVEEKIESMLRLTPEEYLKQQRQASSKNEFHACLKSLSSLYEDCIKGEKSDKELQKQLQAAKDSLGEDAIKYLGKNAQYLTQSLFDLLEKMVMSSSLENPLPFKGDITTLAFDAGNLNVMEETTEEMKVSKEKQS